MKIFDLIVDNFDRLSKYFNLDLRETDKGYFGKCPLHDGDNPSSFTLYKENEKKWQCYTRDCHNELGNHSLGLLAGLLQKKFNRKYTNTEAKQWAQLYFNIDLPIEDTNSDERLTSFLNKINKEPSVSFKITEKEFLSRLVRPATYFLDRKYKEETLDYFRLGFCPDPTKPMYQRVVVPQFSQDGNYIIGCLGRIVFDKCPSCGHFHNPQSLCRTSPKWKNSINFPSSTSLFNYHNAKKYIKQTGITLLVEGSPNVMRIHESGFPMVVASYGAKFSEYQRNLLDEVGCHTIIIVRDVGEAGINMAEQVKKECKYTHNIVTIEPSYKDDIGECNVETVKKIIGPYVDKIK